MKTNISAATRVTKVDIELPLVMQTGGVVDTLQQMDDDGLWGDFPYIDTEFVAMASGCESEAGDQIASLEDVAAHPSRLRFRWSEQVEASPRVLAAWSATRTGSFGLSELAACGK